ncbi:sulfatase [Myxococcota bacterium]|nr:sulfatase [Myxococcota bacterium]
MLPLLALLACPADPTDPAGTHDSGTSDGGASDGGASDGGASDGGSPDGGSSDGGASDGGDTDGGTGGDDTGEPPPEPVPAVQFKGERPTNVLMISVDTTRRDQLGTYGGGDTTPSLDAILAQGVVLDDHRSCANWTAPSMLCAVNGRWPLADDFWPTGVFEYAADGRVPVTPKGLPTLASLLAERGYRTGLVTSNTVFSDWNSTHIVAGYGEVVNTNWAPVATVNASALAMVEDLQEGDRPWFVHVHYIDPHGPYAAPLSWAWELDEIDPGYEFPFDVTDGSDVYSLFSYWPWLTEEEEELARAYLFAVYRAELRYWDDGVGSLWRQLGAMGALDDTLVVFYSDHGEQFGDHDQFQHGKSLHPEENRVLGAFWADGMIPGRWSGPTEHQDLAPTVLDALGLDPSDRHEGTVVGMAPADRSRFSFCYLVGYCDPVMSVVKNDVQLIYHWDGKRFMYDVALDPASTTDLWAETDPRAMALWTELQPQVQAVAERWPFLRPVDAEP